MKRYLDRILVYGFIYYLIFNYSLIYVNHHSSLEELFSVISYANEIDFVSHLFILIGNVLLICSILINTMDEICEEKELEFYLLHRYQRRKSFTYGIIKRLLFKWIELIVILFLSISLNLVIVLSSFNIMSINIKCILMLTLYCMKLSLIFISLYLISKVLLIYCKENIMIIITFMITVIILTIDKLNPNIALFKFSDNPLTILQPLLLFVTSLSLFAYFSNLKKEVKL